MDLIERISSLMTLLSLFIVAPALGRALLLWWDERTQRSLPSQHVALTVSTMIVLTALIVVYGVVWKANPRLIAWYAWISAEIPIEGSVDIQEPLKVEIAP
jgi:low temperature requirement protein LtrA